MPDDFARERRQLIESLRTNPLISERVLEAMSAVPREAFVDPALRDRAYDDNALPLDEGQTISQPTIVGLMSTALDVQPDSRILEIGTGSGYQAAVLSQLGHLAVSVEIHESLVARARAVLNSFKITNVEVHQGDGSLGWPDAAPYDRIIVTAAAPSVPKPLLEQLRESDGSRLVAPVGSQDMQRLTVLERAAGEIVERHIAEARFVPLRGRAGWDAEDWDDGWKSDWDRQWG